MKKILFILFCAPVLLGAQNAWEVNVGGGGTSGIDPYYSPQFLSIEVGDTVRWTNLQGTHNVDGRIETYPGNPDSFYSGEPSQGWVFTFVFDSIGSYGYQCDQGDHAQTQWGVISVSPINLIQENLEVHVLIFPNPFSSVVMIDSVHLFEDLKVVDLQGRTVYEKDLKEESNEVLINLGTLPAGCYFIQLSAQNTLVSKKLVKDQ